MDGTTDGTTDGVDSGVHPSRAELLEHLRRTYGLHPTAIQPSARGADPQAATYRVESTTEAWFLKLHRSVWDDIGVLVTHLLGGVGGLRQVPAPRPALDGRPVTHLNGFRVVLWPYVDGRNGFEAPLPAAQWPGLGALLRSIHDTPVPQAVQSRLRVEDFGPRWRRAVRRHYADLDRTAVPDAITAELVALLRQRRDRILGLVACAEALAVRLRSHRQELVLCHGDLHAGNVLITAAGEVTVVDWDSALLAPRERDLMFPGAGVGGVWGDEQQARAFLDGYLGGDRGSVSLDAAAIAYYRCERIVEDVAVYCRELFTGQHDVSSRRTMLCQLRDQFEPGDVVDIAERTATLTRRDAGSRLRAEDVSIWRDPLHQQPGGSPAGHE